MSDAECADYSNGYAICTTACLDRGYFPLDKYPKAAEVFGYSSSDKCCRRRCYPQSQCDDGVFGCETNDDCKTGLECAGAGSERKCVDVNECTDIRFSVEANATCGLYATCRNTVGGFECPCITGKTFLYGVNVLMATFPGYDYWTADVGCAEVDECTDSKYTPYSS